MGEVELRVEGYKKLHRCVVCGVPFEARSYGDWYCSQECRTRQERRTVLPSDALDLFDVHGSRLKPSVFGEDGEP